MVNDTSGRGIAAAVGRLISDERLAPGERLPTVRRIADGLGVSPTTVSQAWRSLGRAGLVNARGRSGTYVRGDPRVSAARRMLRVYENPGPVPLDLSTGTPDSALLPDLGPALARVGKRRFAARYADRPVLPELEELLLDRWPFTPGRFTVLNGALDALDRVTSLAARFGDRVLVENPCFPPVLDMLEERGAEPIAIPLDDEGPDPDAVEAAMSAQPVMFVLQPRAHNPSGVNLSRARADRLTAILRTSAVLVVEDDHAGEISGAPLVSLGTQLPDQVVHIQSFSKSLGPDLRLAAVGGAAPVVDAIDRRRLLGPGWSSRLLQAVLVDLLNDPVSVAAVERARELYAERRRLLSALLADRGVALTGQDGINLWVEVAHEHSALLVLAAAGIGAAPGSPFEVEPLASDHLRVTVGLVGAEDAPRVADALGAAAGTVGRRPSGGATR